MQSELFLWLSFLITATVVVVTFRYVLLLRFNLQVESEKRRVLANIVWDLVPYSFRVDYLSKVSDFSDKADVDKVVVKPPKTTQHHSVGL